MFRLLTLLSLCMPAGTAVKTACDAYRSSGYELVAWQCSGMKVKNVPRFLPRSLEMLLLTGTAISSLDNTSFWGRDVPELKTLSVTGGNLISVGPHAFCALPSLMMLHLDHNQLEFLDALSFSCNNALRTVSLVDNPNLHQLPPLVTSSVENLYLDNCSLASIAVADVEKMTVLKVLSLNGNRDLHCPSVKSHFKRARPHLLVICEDPAPELPSLASHDGREHASGKSHNEADSAIENNSEDTTRNAASRIRLSVAAITGISIFIITSF